MPPENPTDYASALIAQRRPGESWEAVHPNVTDDARVLSALAALGSAGGLSSGQGLAIVRDPGSGMEYAYAVGDDFDLDVRARFIEWASLYWLGEIGAADPVADLNISFGTAFVPTVELPPPDAGIPEESPDP